VLTRPAPQVIYDANDVVLSMPPIINGEHSKITLGMSPRATFISYSGAAAGPFNRQHPSWPGRHEERAD
jgi:hypothetical protein